MSLDEQVLAIAFFAVALKLLVWSREEDAPASYYSQQEPSPSCLSSPSGDMSLPGSQSS